MLASWFNPKPVGARDPPQPGEPGHMLSLWRGRGMGGAALVPCGLCTHSPLLPVPTHATAMLSVSDMRADAHSSPRFLKHVLVWLQQV